MRRRWRLGSPACWGPGPAGAGSTRRPAPRQTRGCGDLRPMGPGSKSDRQWEGSACGAGSAARGVLSQRSTHSVRAPARRSSRAPGQTAGCLRRKRAARCDEVRRDMASCVQGAGSAGIKAHQAAPQPTARGWPPQARQPCATAPGATPTRRRRLAQPQPGRRARRRGACRSQHRLKAMGWAAAGLQDAGSRQVSVRAAGPHQPGGHSNPAGAADRAQSDTALQGRRAWGGRQAGTLTRAPAGAAGGRGLQRRAHEDGGAKAGF